MANIKSIYGNILTPPNDHTHANKSTLDGISSTKVSNWDSAYSSRHSHNNKTVLDGITAAKVEAWDTKSGETTHTHANKTVLDGITSTKVSQWNTAYSQSHAHSNKSVLDGISSSDVSNWDGKAEANIKKNPNATTGDVIETHLTIGSRKVGSIIGERSFAQGDDIIASGARSHAEGSNTTASGTYSHAEGNGTTASVDASHAEGSGTTASAPCAHAEGSNTTASGACSHAEGYDTTASGTYSHAEGSYTSASGRFSHAEGDHTEALNYQHVQGHYNKEGVAGSGSGTTGDAFIIGNGTTSAKSNAFRVAYNGSVYGAGAYNSTGADIAELYEWLDGNPDNEDRRGLFVTLTGTKIKLAESTDIYIKGVISAAPALVGDSYSDTWHGMYLTDVFGTPLSQIVHHDAEYEEREITNPETGKKTTENILIHDAYDAEEYIINPEYDPEQEYIPREQRKEYDYVSSWGKLVIVDDGTCEVDGFAKVGEHGKATKSDTITNYRVMERKDENHIYVAIG